MARGKHPAPLVFERAFALLGGYVTALLPLAILFPLAFGLARQVDLWSGKRFSQRKALASLLGIAAIPPFLLTGTILSTGGWIVTKPYAFAIPIVSVLLGSSLFAVLAILRTTDLLLVRVGYSVCCFVGSTLALALDAFVFPSLYETFHHLTFGLAIVLMFLGMESLIEIGVACLRWFPRLRCFLGSVIFLISLTFIFYSTRMFFALDENGRAVLLSRSRNAEYLLTTAKIHEKPPFLSVILDRVEAGRPVLPEPPAPTANPNTIPAAWNVVLLISDAMRADTLPPNRRTINPKKHAHPGDTPFLDGLIPKSFTFQYAYSPSNVTDVSMPSIFTGLTPETLRHKKGTPLSEKIAKSGRKPIAVVNDLFRSKRKKFNSLLRGFERVTSYSEKNQSRAVDTMLSAIDKVGDSPFFAWFHFYALHNPYYADKGRQFDSEGPFEERYRRALKWADKEIKKLFSGFERRGLLQNTVVILTADHGEGLGDHRLKTHGSYVYEEETRVPFYIWMPNSEGGTISSTVGLIDLVATLMDMIGKPATDTEGDSLWPLIENPELPWSRYYYLENASNNYVGIVMDRVKLIYNTTTEIMYRYDLQKDLRERRNLFKLDNEMDQLLLSHLLFHRPDLFLDGFSDADVRTRYRELLSHVGGLKPDAARLMKRIETVRKRQLKAH